MKPLTMPRASRPVNARVSAVGASPAIARAVLGVRARLGREQERGAELRGRGAGREHGRHRRAVADAAGGDERQADVGGGTSRSSASSPSAVASGRSTNVPRWPPASTPWSTSTSAPASRAMRASSGSVTVTHTSAAGRAQARHDLAAPGSRT